MIRLDRVELLNWDIQHHQVLPLARSVTLITGENGSGKTSILDAIKVCLGASSLGDERRISDYVLKQARPVAMIRIIVDNRPEPGTRKRPFDPLASCSRDVVTLAVVFKAVEEREYTRLYYLLDGDVVPLDAIEDPSQGVKASSIKPLPGPTEFRERLKKVGIGSHYLKLLCLPQGQVARLCKYNDGELFEKLFDIIGGRQALEEWERRVAELNEQQLQQNEVKRDLQVSQRELRHLAERAERHQKYIGHKEKLVHIHKALPHLLRQEARVSRDQLAARLTRLEADTKSIAAQKDDADDRAKRARNRSREIETQIGALREQLGQVIADWEKTVEEKHSARARYEELEKLRLACEEVRPRDPAEIENEMERAQTEIGAETAAARESEQRQSEIVAEIEQIDQGLTPFPREVDDFRSALRTAGIIHHLLAEVLEVEDRAWAPAIEGFLGRYRFAVLVQDPSDWQRAATLARNMGYPHGILAPDVRGSSPRDTETLASIIEIKEVRYRSLLARLLRAVTPGEPEVPLSPVSRGVLLAKDGFAISRMEARVAREDRFYLGLDARAKRRADLIEDLEREKRHSKLRLERAAALRAELNQLREDLSRQQKRLQFEAARDEHAETRERAATLQKHSEKLEETRRYLESEIEVRLRDASQVNADEHIAKREFDEAREQLEKLNEEHERLLGQKQEADEKLGRLLTEELEPLDEVEQELLQSVPSVDTLHGMERETQGIIAEFSESERDPALPVNLKRQSEEVAAVTKRLARMAEDLEATRAAAEEARDHYQQTTKMVFRRYFAKLSEAARELDFSVEGRLEPRENGRFRCDIRVGVGEKTPVHYSSEELSGGQKAALSILMGMTAVSLEDDAAGFFLIDEPFAASDVVKINELGQFLKRTGAQYLVSMPTSADLDQCRDWLRATWTCTRSRGGYDKRGAPILAPPLKLGFSKGARDE